MPDIKKPLPKPTGPAKPQPPKDPGFQKPTKPTGPSKPAAPQRTGEAANYNLSNRASNPGTLKTVGEQQSYDRWTATGKDGMLHTVPQQGPGADKYGAGTITIPWSSVKGGMPAKYKGPSGVPFEGGTNPNQNMPKTPAGLPGFSGTSNMNGHKAAGVPNRAASRAQF